MLRQFPVPLSSDFHPQIQAGQDGRWTLDQWWSIPAGSHGPHPRSRRRYRSAYSFNEGHSGKPPSDLARPPHQLLINPHTFPRLTDNHQPDTGFRPAAH
jgi:hypothetical protein